MRARAYPAVPRRVIQPDEEAGLIALLRAIRVAVQDVATASPRRPRLAWSRPPD